MCSVPPELLEVHHGRLNPSREGELQIIISVFMEV